MIDLEELRKLAEAARAETPGEWVAEDDTHDSNVFTTVDGERWAVFICLTTGTAHYAAAANPATLLALLDVVEAAKKHVKFCPEAEKHGLEAKCDIYGCWEVRKALARLEVKEGKT